MTDKVTRPRPAAAVEETPVEETPVEASAATYSPYVGTTHAERMANVDVDAVRPDGRLVGVYAEDLAAEAAERTAAQREGREPRPVHETWTTTDRDAREKTADKVRAAAVGTVPLPDANLVGLVTVHPDAAPTPEEARKRTEEYNARAEAAART